ncbi:sigma-70 family RNA polymerase sigma factor [Agrobacterium fabacearum]|uniref:sigma-70 family RNA polymerase sigma factor n=1 Tax=Agrobacterium tumefaciens TaxID=358 RepID=UPI0028533A4F|nr:sigma-70 family RNA polymerase sigma factor [Agrobacterium tumefaciens]MDR5008273.1 sigma-70 family RNA polymerase sigma factor [Agrobacterium tumefaciens]
MTPAAMNDNRPKSFDDALLAYQPGMRRLASKLGYRGSDAADLVTDTIAYCLEHWTNFRGATDKMWNWIYWQMRGLVKNSRSKRRVMMVAAGTAYEFASVSGGQVDVAHAGQVVGMLSGRAGAMTMRLAMGDTLEEIARQHGLSRERVRQLVEKERERVRGLLGEAV